MLALIIFSLLISRSFCCLSSSKPSSSDLLAANPTDSIVTTTLGHTNSIPDSTTVTSTVTTTLGHTNSIPDSTTVTSTVTTSLGQTTVVSNPFLVNSTVTLTSGHSNSISSLILLTSGNFASGSADRNIKIWSSTTETLLRTLSGHTGGITGLAALNDDNLASVGSDGILKIWSANSTTATRSVPISGSSLTAIAKLSNGNVAVALSFDNSMRVYDPNTGNRASPNFTKSHTDAIKFLMTLSNGNLASASNDKTIKIWDVATGAVIRTLTGHTGFVLCLREIGLDLASGSTDLKIKIWDLTTGLEKKSINSFHQPYSIEYLSNNYLTGGTQLGFLDFYDTTGKLYKTEKYGSSSIHSQLKLTSGNLVIGDSIGALRILKF